MRLEQRFQQTDDAVAGIRDEISGMNDQLKQLLKVLTKTPNNQPTVAAPNPTNSAPRAPRPSTASMLNTTIDLDTSISVQTRKLNTDIISRSSYPKYNQESGRDTVTHFLLQTVGNFCKNRNLSTDHLKLWVHLCFDKKYQAKIEFYVTEIIKKNTALDAHDFLIALGL